LAPGLVCMGVENLAVPHLPPEGISSVDHPAHSESLSQPTIKTEAHVRNIYLMFGTWQLSNHTIKGAQ